MSNSNSLRRPYYGSCHCGYTRYICYLTFPPPVIDPDALANSILPKKCNCTTCHKLSLFQLRLADAPTEFVLLSPTNPFAELSDYTCGSGLAHLFFCGKCGGRCFAFGISEEQGETVDIDLEVWLGKESEGKLTRVWRPKREGYEEEKTAMLRVIATSLDAEQEGLDMREWHEKGWIVYANGLKDQRDGQRLGKPFPGGAYC